MIIWLPVPAAILGFIISITDFHYPVFNPICIGLTILTLTPTVIAGVIPKGGPTRKHAAQRILLALCIISIPFSFITSLGIVTRSATTDISNYRVFDAACIANRDPFFQDLFPAWPHSFTTAEQPDGTLETVCPDTHYFYQSLAAIDYTYDIYAKWPLDKDAFDEEVARVTALYNERAPAQEDTKQYPQLCDPAERRLYLPGNV